MLTLKRISLLFISLLVCSACSYSSNKEPEGGWLWRISGNGLTQPSYLFGTWHGTNAILSSYMDSIPGLYQAFDSCRQYVGEVANLEELQSYASKMDVKLPQDTTWADLLDESEMQFLDSVLIQRINAPLDKVYIKPGFLALMLTKIEENEKLIQAGYTQAQINRMNMQVIDIVLSVKAKEKGYTVLGLETIEEQMDMLFNSDDLKKEAKALVKNLRNPLSKKIAETMTDKLQAVYRAQNLSDLAQFELEMKAKMDSLWQGDPEMKDGFKDFSDELVIKRNLAWAEKIPVIIKDKPTFIGVGVRHLPGEAGVIRLLQEKGYKVEAVR